MLGTFASAIGRAPVLFCWVVPHHEVALIPFGRIIVDVSVVHVLQIVLNTDVEETIVFGRNDTTLLIVIHIPSLICVTPLPNEAFSAPWVSNQEESLTIGQFQQVEQDEGVIGSDIVTGIRIWLCRYDVLLIIVILNSIPECVGILFVSLPIVRKEVIRTSIEKADWIEVLACVEVPVISNILRDCLLKDSSPEGIVGADLSEKTVTIASEGQVIINVGCIGDTKCVNIQAVNTLFTHFCVVEDFLNSLWILSKSTEGSENPTVSNATLS